MRSVAFVVAPFVALALSGPALAQDAKVEKGKAVYESAMPKCKTCHAIGGVGNREGRASTESAAS